MGTLQFASGIRYIFNIKQKRPGALGLSCWLMEVAWLFWWSLYFRKWQVIDDGLLPGSGVKYRS